MKCYFLQLTTVTFLWLMTSQLNAQQAVTVSVFNESTTIPFTTFINSPLHPGVQVGTEFEGHVKNHFRLYPSITVGYMFHKKLFQGLYADANIGVDYQTGFGVNIKTKLGLGYLHTFTTQEEYQFNGSTYESKGDRGNARVMPSFTIGLGYNLQKNNPLSTEIFFLYQSWIEYPYSPGFIPLMSHTNIHFGTKFYPSKAK
ncbi:hypothetical protein [Lewinella sp. LCG006]|uniref:hypothetical protein n=1 Tax=Lewinella sp. LCG006 TaxID=3231911 RepID=UPI00345FA02E